ncbi:MAG: homoserine dehydrogenase [Clostridia bacterium]|nr:homoserine dehydrogenase [Clostridia bacterium]
MGKVAVMGYGVVGSGVVEILHDNKDTITKTLNEEIDVKYILDIRDFSNDPYADLVTNDFNKILNDDEIDVVAEAMGGLNPAYNFTKQLLLSGKSVVTSNKELVATHGAELLKIAQEKNVNYMFEASVGGGIPIIRPLMNCIAGNVVTEIDGIVNGTTNYILSQMFKNGKSFDDALKDAQEKGYAEKDPTADVEGYDACRKIAILASLSSGQTVDYNQIKTIGISKITSDDVKYAEKINSVIKLIATFKIENNKLYSSVQPAIVGNDCPIAVIDDVYNGIMVKGNMVQDLMFYGRGAGKLPTASAVVADIIDCFKLSGTNNGCIFEPLEADFMRPYEENKEAFMVILSGNVAEIKTKTENLFVNPEYISIKDNEIAVITNELTVSELESKLSDLPVVKKIKILR